MRIIAGSLRGRPLAAPGGRNTRPTSGRLREALLQHLTSARLQDGFSELNVLDLFAGSGALGIEALSRGAACAEFYENDRHALNALHSNIETLGLGSVAAVVRGRLPGSLDRGALNANLVFCDPPYAYVLDDAFFGRLATRCAPEALLVYEHDTATRPPAPGPRWEYGDTRTWGRASVSFYRHKMP